MSVFFHATPEPPAEAGNNDPLESKQEAALTEQRKVQEHPPMASRQDARSRRARLL